MRHTTHQVADQKPLNNNDFHSLGIRDLLDARDQFHVHLARKSNVFSTAIGRYLIRDGDPDAEEQGAGKARTRKRKADDRTLLNSSVKPWSWPCILVFVKEWQTLEDLIHHPEDVVPPFVDMPDGRTVPICVVLAEPAHLPTPPNLDPSHLAATSLGIGSPVYVDAQGMRRMGTVGCMVSDGSDFYVLINKHLAGEVGRPVRALLRGVPTIVGTTQGTRGLTERTFSDVYPSLPGRDSVVNIDAAVVRLDDAMIWDATAVTEPIGDVADFSAAAASLSWIGRPVAGHGAASGEMRGQIMALFYRYKSVGGRDYIADFLISAREKDDPLFSRPGDSGSLWCVDDVEKPGTRSPFALEWGGQQIGSGPEAGQFLQFSLATSMAVILRELNLDVLSGPTAERTQYWGPVGHFKIGQQACFHVGDPALQKFLIANINNLSFSADTQLEQATHLQATDFVPLSDVPDVVWKTNINHSKPKVARAMENWNHYADIDLPGTDGRTLIDQYRDDQNSLNYGDWLDFYKTASPPSKATAKSLNQGALPFRVWQIFARMLQYAQNGAGAEFLTAAGCLAHYIGDACQPLHSSQHSDGLDGASTGVHSTYEDNMVDAHADDIAAGIADAIKDLNFTPRAIRSPRDAAKAAMDLMIFAHDTLPPVTICEVYNEARPAGGRSATKSPAVLNALWKKCGEQTIEVIAAGAVTLGAIWAAAWKLSGAAKDSPWLAKVLDGRSELMPIYEQKDFLISLHLAYLGQQDLPGSDAPNDPPAPPGGRPPAPAAAKRSSAAARRGGSPKKKPTKN